MKKQMNWIFAVSGMSLLVSVLYWSKLWFSFDFLGEEIGSERNAVGTWAGVNLFWAALLSALAYTQLKKVHRKTARVIVTLTKMHLCIQAFPVLLWIILGDPGASWRGILAHGVVIALCIAAWTRIMKELREMRKSG
jgi:hypothetical protein